MSNTQAKKLPLNLIRVSGVGVNPTRADVTAGYNKSCSITMDEPVERGGGNEGMWPLEAFLAGLAGCANVVMHIIAKDLGIQLSNINIDVAGHLDPRGYLGYERLETPFVKITVSISGVAQGATDQLEELKSQLVWRCPAAATLYAAGIEMNEKWALEVR